MTNTERLAATIAARSTDVLVTALAALVAKGTLDKAEQLVSAATVVELTARHDHVGDAIDAWLDDMNSPFVTDAEVVVAALAA